jgi:carbon-monoxide dehydrogenase large subunit
VGFQLRQKRNIGPDYFIVDFYVKPQMLAGCLWGGGGGVLGWGLGFLGVGGGLGTCETRGCGIGWGGGPAPAVVRLTPDGILEVRCGVHSHGQSMETTLAQIASEVLGISPAHVRVVLGDTGATPYSTGTWGSRSIVMAGGAVGQACKELKARLNHIAAWLLEVAPDTVRWESAGITAGSATLSVRDVAHAWYRAPQTLPPDVDARGLEVHTTYQARRDTGTFSYACHAVVVAVDTELGKTEILDYVIVEDGGVLINPMVVDGQVYGGAAQGIGTALSVALR